MTGSDRPISLSKARKSREREKKAVQATANSLKFGRTKAERTADEAEGSRARRLIDGHRREDTPKE
ncbi:MAG: DUF4169 family protein [Rhodobacteraceae bacterium]|nr:DUF4169 family protein [Paracoccaceae bacterium]